MAKQIGINIKNYTTGVAADSSIAKIEALLVSAGASYITKQYAPTAGKVAAIRFIIPVNDMQLPFVLPVNVDAVYSWLKKKSPKGKDATLLNQAERIAWKQQYEWLHMQLSHIALKQAEVLELFFPFLLDTNKGQTYYQRIKEGGYKALASG